MHDSEGQLERNDQDTDGVFVDNMQLKKSADTRLPREQQFAEIRGELKSIARDFGISVFALARLRRSDRFCQLNQDPVLTDLRNSGAIEQDADIVIFMTRRALRSDRKKSKDKKDGIMQDSPNCTDDEGDDGEDFGDGKRSDISEKEKGQDKLLIRKHRTWPAGTVKLRFLKKSAKLIPLWQTALVLIGSGSRGGAYGNC
ncbi:MAG: hypothetical protein LBQ79_10460 [Deltaproteobacteria bacterium]|jgi:replicative DNA helicase|nr:hypothetical protein [Deltaproteobacteria bacterium]